VVMATEGGIKVPGIGHLSKKEMYIGGTAAGLVVIFALYRAHEKSQEAAAATSTGSDDGSDTAIDPTTGLPAGSPEDVAELEQESEEANDTDYGYASGGYDDTDTGQQTEQFTSNAAWSQAAQEYITNYSGGDAATVSAALGAYITGSYVTPAQQNIIEQAIAFDGAPPQSGANGYPPSINTTPPSTGTGTGTGGTTKTIAQAVGTQVKFQSNIASFGSVAKLAAYFDEGIPEIQANNPGLNLNAKTGAVTVPYLIKKGDTLASIAAKFKENPENIAAVLATQGIS
jgi:LysM repeat protein